MLSRLVAITCIINLYLIVAVVGSADQSSFLLRMKELEELHEKLLQLAKLEAMFAMLADMNEELEKADRMAKMALNDHCVDVHRIGVNQINSKYYILILNYVTYRY